MMTCPVIIGPVDVLGFLRRGEANEEQEIYRGADHTDIARSGIWDTDCGFVPETQLFRAVILPLAVQPMKGWSS